MRQETDYVLHHAQKIISIFAGMRALAKRLEAQGHRVHYLRISNPENTQTIEGNLNALITKHRCKKFEYQQPDEWRLDAQLSNFCHALSIPTEMVSSEHFFTERLETAVADGALLSPNACQASRLDRCIQKARGRSMEL